MLLSNAGYTETNSHARHLSPLYSSQSHLSNKPLYMFPSQGVRNSENQLLGPFSSTTGSFSNKKRKNELSLKYYTGDMRWKSRFLGQRELVALFLSPSLTLTQLPPLRCVYNESTSRLMTVEDEKRIHHIFRTFSSYYHLGAGSYVGLHE